MVLSESVQEKLLQTKEGYLWTSSFLKENCNFFIKEVKPDVSELIIEEAVPGRVAFVGYLDHQTKEINMASSELKLEDGPIKIKTYSTGISRKIFYDAMDSMMDVLLLDGCAVDIEEFLAINCLEHAVNTNRFAQLNFVKAEGYLSTHEYTGTLKDFILETILGKHLDEVNEWPFITDLSKRLRDVQIPYQQFVDIFLAEGKEKIIANQHFVNLLIEQNIPGLIYSFAMAWTDAKRCLKRANENQIRLFSDICSEIKSYGNPIIEIKLTNGEVIKANRYQMLNGLAPLHFYSKNDDVLYSIDKIDHIRIQKKVFKVKEN